MLNGRSLVPLITHVESSLAIIESLDRADPFGWLAGLVSWLT